MSTRKGIISATFKPLQFTTPKNKLPVQGATHCLGIAFTGQGGIDAVIEIPHANIESFFAESVGPNGDPGGSLALSWTMLKAEITNGSAVFSSEPALGLIPNENRPSKPTLTPGGFQLLGRLKKGWGAGATDDRPQNRAFLPKALDAV